MDTQHQITAAGTLLDEAGRLREPGWARAPLLTYSRAAIKARPWRIKEWDYYLVYNQDFGVALTVADNSYLSLLSASLLKFDQPWQHTASLMGGFPFGKLALSEDSDAGVSAWSHGNSRIAFETESGVRKLFGYIDRFIGRDPLYVDLGLFDEPADSMVIATPFAGDPQAFYYNRKICCLRAQGKVEFRGRTYKFSPEDSFGILDWGRGVWTYKNTWYWGAASGLHEGKPFGFNIGYGFGDTAAASENMLFWEGRVHKLGRIAFHIPQQAAGGEDYLAPWTFDSDDGRFEMAFQPVLDRAAKTDVGVICSDQHQVFGRFTGRAVLDDGAVLEIRDLLGFAEKVYNKW